MRLGPVAFGAILVTAPITAQSGDLREISTSISPFFWGPPPAVGFDTARGVTMLVTFHPGPPLRLQTWEFAGSDWSLRDSVLAPPDLAASGVLSDLVHDPLRQRTVLVSTTSFPTALTYTSEWDGTRWTVRDAGTLPRADLLRGCFHPGLGESVFVTTTRTTSSLWSWNGVRWRSLGAAQERGPIAFHAATGRLVASGSSWDGTSWTPHQRLPRGPTTMTSDLDHGHVFAQLSELHEWTGSGWTPVRGSDIEGQAVSVFDNRRGQHVLVLQTEIVTPVRTWTFTHHPDHVATLTSFGDGCAGPAGPITLAAPERPLLGATIDFQVTPLPTLFQRAFVLLGTDRSQWLGRPLPFDLAAIGAPGCIARLAPTQVLAGAPLSLTVPWRAELLGFDVHAQAAMLVPGFNPAHLILSNALQLAIGNR